MRSLCFCIRMIVGTLTMIVVMLCSLCAVDRDSDAEQHKRCLECEVGGVQAVHVLLLSG